MKRRLASLALCALVAVSACKREREPESRSTPAAPDRHKPQASPAAAPTPAAPVRLPAAARVIAIGDLHGDFDQARAALRLGGAIDKEDDWIGKRLVVVQVGDELDRGNGEESILELFDALADKAKAAGGAVIPLDGNHEVMNVQGDFRYVTHDGFSAFAHFTPAGPPPPALQVFPELARGRAFVFLPGGRFARLLAKRNVIQIVGDTVFVHGGVLPAHVDYGIERIDAETSAWMRGELPRLPPIMQSQDAPIWTRRYSEGEPDADTCAELGKVLASLHVKRMVVGHTVQTQGVSSACDGRVWRIDVGLSHFYDGPTQALEIAGDKLQVLGAKQK